MSNLLKTAPIATAAVTAAIAAVTTTAVVVDLAQQRRNEAALWRVWASKEIYSVAAYNNAP